MANLFDYRDWRGDLRLEDSPFCEVDAMILARLSYLPFERTSLAGGSELTVKAAAAEILALPEIETSLLLRDDLRFLRALSASRRFRSLPLFGQESETCAETQTQFSAIGVRLSPKRIHLSFRGTDNTLIGWKEDLDMGFVCPVPAQSQAVRYLEKMASARPGEITLGGHSKGGNLAVYAAAFCREEIQSRIRTVYNYDGPGFDDCVLQTEGYQKVCARVKTYVPQSSVVGMLLGHREKTVTVHSDNQGLTQHDLYSWEVARNRFVTLRSVTQSSRFVDQTLKHWLGELSHDQRELFVDAVYTVLRDTNASTLREMGERRWESAMRMLRSFTNLDPLTRRAAMTAVGMLLKSTRAGFDGLRAAGEEGEKEKSARKKTI